MFSVKVLYALLLVNFQFHCFKSENVTVKLFNMAVLKQKIVIDLEDTNNLKEVLPRFGYDTLTIEDDNLPVIAKDFLSNLDEVVSIEMLNDGIEVLMPGCFKELQSLRTISLPQNKIKNIPEGVFDNLNISSLNLRSNAIENIDGKALNNMPNLINIDLENNNIKIWNSDWFYNTPFVSRINFRNNSLEKLPANAFNNIQGNKVYLRVPLKRTLQFSYNRLKTIDIGAFNGLSEINNLWLDHNQLQSFNEVLIKNAKIEELRLDGNEIKRLSGNWKNLLEIPFISVDANPFDCDFLRSIKEWSDENHKKIDVFYSDMDCVVNRIKGKMDDIRNRLEQLKEERMDLTTIEPMT
ncbi:unnamed protein product [Brassicogethes aeneus]|uniref:Uncharacterized protein n=1 Tax=Brassicogethes aeneus TaxID=1431903 RepID=A0A9P0B0K2_BRAAE|nr:unnamed protein product [Brassicogethes aeneus]